MGVVVFFLIDSAFRRETGIFFLESKGTNVIIRSATLTHDSQNWGKSPPLSWIHGVRMGTRLSPVRSFDLYVVFKQSEKWIFTVVSCVWRWKNWITASIMISVWEACLTLSEKCDCLFIININFHKLKQTTSEIREEFTFLNKLNSPLNTIVPKAHEKWFLE